MSDLHGTFAVPCKVVYLAGEEGPHALGHDLIIDMADLDMVHGDIRGLEIWSISCQQVPHAVKKSERGRRQKDARQWR